MRRIYENWSSCFRIDPSSVRAAARDNEYMNLVVFDHAELQIAVEWRS
jgi:hypothetical protein